MVVVGNGYYHFHRLRALGAFHLSELGFYMRGGGRGGDWYKGWMVFNGGNGGSLLLFNGKIFRMIFSLQQIVFLSALCCSARDFYFPGMSVVV